MFTLNCKGRLVTIDKAMVMGILNVTPDSFYNKSRVQQIDEAIEKAAYMLNNGASIIDIGGQSTRPGSHRISAEEEEQRVLPIIRAVHQNFPDALISVDTFYSIVALKAVEAGGSIINDVSAATIDPDMIRAAASLRVPYVLMHMKGDPQTMQNKAVYDNVVLEVFDFLNQQLQILHDAGVNDVIVDPGLGFGKTAAHNFQLINNLEFFHQLGKPVMVGLSRKATVYKTLEITAEEALNGTTVLNTACLLAGANILRVHDVKEAAEAVILIDALKKNKEHV